MKTHEQRIVEMAGEMLTGAVNVYLNEADDYVPPFELKEDGALSNFGVAPEIVVADAEMTEKARVIRVYTYTVKIRFVLTRCTSRWHRYMYAYAIEQAVNADPSFGGIADGVTLRRKAFKKVKGAARGACKAVFTLEVTIEK
jgi:hypothetical protein